MSDNVPVTEIRTETQHGRVVECRAARLAECGGEFDTVEETFTSLLHMRVQRPLPRRIYLVFKLSINCKCLQ